MSENETQDLPMTEQSAAEILVRLEKANPHLMSETLATLTKEQRQAAEAASYAKRSGR